MSQHDYTIDNATFPTVRSDMNNAYKALASTNSGSSAPTTTYANQMWIDTAVSGTPKLKVRNAANTAWITLGDINESAGTFDISGSASGSSTSVVMEAIADSTYLGVGTHILAQCGVTVTPGQTTSGSNLRPASLAARGSYSNPSSGVLLSGYAVVSGSSVSGTWKACGYCATFQSGNYNEESNFPITLFLRTA